MSGTSFVALYRGQSVATARLVAVSADPHLVATVSDALITETAALATADAAGGCLERGRRSALRVMGREAHQAAAADGKPQRSRRGGEER
jgi:hypothetical protein